MRARSAREWRRWRVADGAGPRMMPAREFFGEAYNQSMLQLAGSLPRLPELGEGERRLGSFVLPRFQRGAAWTTAQRASLIASVYKGYPIGGGLIWNQTEGACDRWLLDGQQRLSAILDYLAGAYPVCGHRFPYLPTREQAHFHRLNVAMVRTSIDDPAKCEELYDCIAFGGTPHERAHRP